MLEHDPSPSGGRPPAAVPEVSFEVFFDGECPLCAREIAFLRRRDKGGRVRFTDISAKEFDAATTGRSFEALMDRIHGRLPDGRVVEGVDVFRHLYGALGFARLVALSRLPGISWLLDWSYRVFARNRLRWTGRCDARNGRCVIAPQ